MGKSGPTAGLHALRLNQIGLAKSSTCLALYNL